MTRNWFISVALVCLLGSNLTAELLVVKQTKLLLRDLRCMRQKGFKHCAPEQQKRMVKAGTGLAIVLLSASGLGIWFSVGRLGTINPKKKGKNRSDAEKREAALSRVRGFGKGSKPKAAGQGDEPEQPSVLQEVGAALEGAGVVAGGEEDDERGAAEEEPLSRQEALAASELYLTVSAEERGVQQLKNGGADAEVVDRAYLDALGELLADSAEEAPASDAADDVEVDVEDSLAAWDELNEAEKVRIVAELAAADSATE